MKANTAVKIIAFSIIIIILQCEFSIYIIARIDSDRTKNSKIIQNWNVTLSQKLYWTFGRNAGDR